MWAPNPKASQEGGLDTTDMECRYGNPAMYASPASTEGTVCCGLRPHINWIFGTCSRDSGGDPGSDGQFCTNLPPCFYQTRSTGQPAAQINYIAAYQYDGQQFVLMPDSSCGDLTADGISGNYDKNTGFEKSKDNFTWSGGDWTTKYAPASKFGDGNSGPRGVTPPAGLFVLSAQNAFYLAFYMLSQLGINLEKHHALNTNCWMYELDPVEGTAGWSGRGGPITPSSPAEHFPGNINHLYFTSSSAFTGCMAVTNNSSQGQGLIENKIVFPEYFREYCKTKPSDPGCGLNNSWSGGAESTDRFENAWGQPYVFVIVIDGDGYWTYRFIPDAAGKTSWDGINQFSAASKIAARPAKITDPAGLQTYVKADVPAAVILQPGLSEEGGCLRAYPEIMDAQWGPLLLSNVAAELGQTDKVPGAHNWWRFFTSTGQLQDYPPTIMGVPLQQQTYNCNSRNDPPLAPGCACTPGAGRA